MGQVYSTQSLNKLSKSVKILQKVFTLNSNSSGTSYAVVTLSSSDPVIYLGNLVSVTVVPDTGLGALRCVYCGAQSSKDSQGRLYMTNFTAMVMNATSTTSGYVYFNIAYLDS